MILYSTVAGEGEALVLLHSGGMTGESEFGEQSEFFVERGYRVIRPDLRGHGRSVGAIDGYFGRCVKDLCETLDVLGVDRCHVAGVSVGGIVALLFAKAFSERVLSVCFSGVLPEEPEDWGELLAAEDAWYEKLFADRETAAALDELHGESDWRGLLRSFNAEGFYPFDELGDVSEVGVRALCLVGEGELREVAGGVRFRELSDRIHLSVLPFAGHLVHRESPGLYSEVLFAFVRGEGG